LIAKVVHISLNARGGAERLAVVTIKALRSMGIDVELATTDKPDMALIKDAYGESTSLDIKKIRKLDLFNKNEKAGCDLTINTHGDMLPFFREDFTKKNSIVYCHYPTARYLTDLGDPMYSDILQDMSRCSLKYTDNFSAEARNPYCKMMQNSTVLTNSEFSRRAIFREFGVDSTVLPPPVDVDIFRNAALSSDARDESVLVVSRFHQSKKLENAIRLAEMLKQNGTGRYVKIAGNMSQADAAYFGYLNDLVRQHGLEDFVKFEVNINFDRLLDLMRKAKVYFHPMPGEPFGISTVEAMSAGLIPVVPAIGGHTEFVPLKYQFRTFGEAVEAVATALDAPAAERIQISHSAQKYSTASFVKKLQQIVTEVLGTSKPIQSIPLIARLHD
jgi:glycosyltransferase involved in cell wall biosynthesis